MKVAEVTEVKEPVDSTQVKQLHANLERLEAEVKEANEK